MTFDQYTNDTSIPDEAILWRRIPHWHLVPDEKVGGLRPSKAAFDDHPNGSPMSIVFADLVVESGRGPQDILIGHDRFALAALTAGLARSKKQGVAKEPLPDEPAHGVVFGNKTDSVKRTLAKKSTWVIPPPDALEQSGC